MTELEVELATKIDAMIVSEIVQEYNELKIKYSLRDFPACIRASGAFCESAMKALLYLRDGQLTSKMGLKFEASYNDIITKTPTPSSTELEYAFRLIPQVARSVYDIRSKKWGSHARGEELLSMDLDFVATAADWILASLLFVSHSVSEERAFQMISEVVGQNTPLMLKFGGYNVLIAQEITAKAGIAVTVSCFGGIAGLSEVQTILLRRWSTKTVKRALTEARKDLLIFLDEVNAKMHLLPEGRKLAEKVALEHLNKT